MTLIQATRSLNTNLNNCKIIFGTKSVTLSRSTSMALFTLNDLKTRFGVSDNSIYHYLVLVMNGDAAACGAYVSSAVWYNTTVMAVFETSVNQKIRINYLVVYTPNQVDEEEFS